MTGWYFALALYALGAWHYLGSTMPLESGEPSEENIPAGFYAFASLLWPLGVLVGLIMAIVQERRA